MINRPFRTFCLVAIMCVSAFVPGAAHAGLIIRPPSVLNLAAYWTFDRGTVNIGSTSVFDVSGHGNTGTTAFLTTGDQVAGKRGQALHFDGNVTSITLAANPIGSSMTGGNSACAWVRTDDVTAFPGGWDQTFLNLSSGSDGVRVGSIADSGKLYASYYLGGVYYGVESSAATFADGTWTHACYTWDGSQVKLYANGELLSSSANSNTVAASNTIGARTDVAEGNWYGSIDDVRVFTRTLSASEIRQMYASGAFMLTGNSSNKLVIGATNPGRGTTLDDGLVGYWSMNNQDLNWSTGTVYDRSGQGNNGSMISLGTTTSPVQGKMGQAMRFVSASSQKINVPSSSSLNIAGEMTISAWIKKSSTGSARIVSKVNANGATNNPYDFGVLNDHLYLVRANGSTSRLMTDQFRTVPTDDWRHVSMVTGRSAFKNVSKVLTAANSYRIWQGVATDGTYLYTVTDRNSSFGLNNIISKFDMAGNLIQEKTNSYNPFPAGEFYSFGNATVIGSYLYVTAYNYNYVGIEGTLQSRISVFNLSDLSFVQDYDLGTTVKIAEGVDYHDGYYWVIDGYFDTYKVLKYDSSFNLVGTYTLPVVGQIGVGELTYQNISWSGNEIFVNYHGSNTFGSVYAYGLDRYAFNDGVFTFKERIRPVTYGAGQGIAIHGNTFYWADRPGNSVYSANYVGTGNGDVDDSSVVFYLDAIGLAVNSTTTISATTNSKSLLVGARDDATNYFNGIFDDVRIYNRALSVPEVQQLYRMGL